MTDIVIQLRTVDIWDDAVGLMDQAADEIERLREAMRLMYAHYHADNGAELVATYEKAMRDEIELLREELKLIKRERDAWHADAVGLDAV